MFTIEERLQLFKWYNDNLSLRKVSDVFHATYPDRPIPSPTTISRIVSKFHSTGCFENGKKVRRSHVLTEAKKQEIINVMKKDNTLSARKLAEIMNVSRSSVYAVLKEEKLKCYESQELDDEVHKSSFREIKMEKIEQDDTILQRILFTDGTTFFVCGEESFQNSQCWNRQNLYLFRSKNMQTPQRVYVWAGIINNRIVGPFFIDGTFTAKRYLELLQEQIIPVLCEMGINLNEIWFQQDCAPVHNSQKVRSYLNSVFQDRVIGSNVRIPLSSESSDLSPNDISLWDYIQKTAFDSDQMTVEQLRTRISVVVQEIPSELLVNIVKGFYNRLGYFLTVNGSISESSFE